MCTMPFFALSLIPSQWEYLYCKGRPPNAVLALGYLYYSRAVLIQSEAAGANGTLLSSRYCFRLPVDVLVGAVALNAPGLNTLVAYGERACCKRGFRA